jgi:hypothetical protein
MGYSMPRAACMALSSPGRHRPLVTAFGQLGVTRGSFQEAAAALERAVGQHLGKCQV